MVCGTNSKRKKFGMKNDCACGHVEADHASNSCEVCWERNSPLTWHKYGVDNLTLIEQTAKNKNLI